MRCKSSISRFILLILGVVMCLQIGAQQSAQFSQFMMNKYRYNPAYAGMDFSLSLTAVHRSQWAGITGSPTTQNVSAHMPFYLWSGSFGINVENQSIGAERNLEGTLSYSYVQELPFGLLSFGLKAGLIQKTLNGNLLRSPDGIYEGQGIDHQDQFIPEGIVRASAPVLGLGAFFKNEYIEFGIAVDNIPDTRFGLDGTNIVRRFHGNVFLEYDWQINEIINLYPSVIIQTDLKETQIEFATLIELNGNIFGGIGFRGYSANSFDSAIAIVGWRFNEHYKLSYSYDLGLSGLSQVNEGSHEILLNYNLNKLIGAGLPPKIIYNPRFL